MARPKKPPKSGAIAESVDKRKSAPVVDPIVAGGVPPPWVASIPGALAEWKALVPERVRLKIHTVLDVNSFGRYCVLMALFKKTIELVNADGPTTPDGKGIERKAASLSALLDIEKCLKALEVEMGGTAKARNFLRMAPDVNAALAAARAEFFSDQGGQ